jgi:hypothetical protein
MSDPPTTRRDLAVAEPDAGQVLVLHLAERDAERFRAFCASLGDQLDPGEPEFQAGVALAVLMERIAEATP